MLKLSQRLLLLIIIFSFPLSAQEVIAKYEGDFNWKLDNGISFKRNLIIDAEQSQDTKLFNAVLVSDELKLTNLIQDNTLFTEYESWSSNHCIVALGKYDDSHSLILPYEKAITLQLNNLNEYSSNGLSYCPTDKLINVTFEHSQKFKDDWYALVTPYEDEALYLNIGLIIIALIGFISFCKLLQYLSATFEKFKKIGEDVENNPKKEPIANTLKIKSKSIASDILTIFEKITHRMAYAIYEAKRKSKNNDK